MAKTAEKTASPTGMGAGRIQARVSDFAHGVRVYDNVRLVRIKSREYTLLIMEDYFPLLGSVEGHVELVQDTEQVDLGSFRGFFLHRDNEFSLLIESPLAEPSQEAHHGR